MPQRETGWELGASWRTRVTLDKLLCLSFPFCYREGAILLFTVSL